ncbi:hypothetical protein PGTUg99_011948 [Puccinia graminis f. sp. tritici]|uniref:Uncharacterized protein n=1 Tax=Puccinia graminis f. sp. tritici TaxID=56615 RepID=A0A5B0MWC7_PUCGR|nr:hypothetical protein PGTUg99_011948 [Puccinia graminis f. sp. tritici]
MPGQLVNGKIGHQGLASGLSKSTGTPVPRSRANVFLNKASATKNDGGWASPSGMQEVILLPGESQDWW